VELGTPVELDVPAEVSRPVEVGTPANDVPAGTSAIAKMATMVPRPIRDMNTG
jgi:hypothetical protein